MYLFTPGKLGPQDIFAEFSWAGRILVGSRASSVSPLTRFWAGVFFGSVHCLVGSLGLLCDSLGLVISFAICDKQSVSRCSTLEGNIILGNWERLFLVSVTGIIRPQGVIDMEDDIHGSRCPVPISSMPSASDVRESYISL